MPTEWTIFTFNVTPIKFIEVKINHRYISTPTSTVTKCTSQAEENINIHGGNKQIHCASTACARPTHAWNTVVAGRPFVYPRSSTELFELLS